MQVQFSNPSNLKVDSVSQNLVSSNSKNIGINVKPYGVDTLSALSFSGLSMRTAEQVCELLIKKVRTLAPRLFDDAGEKLVNKTIKNLQVPDGVKKDKLLRFLLSLKINNDSAKLTPSNISGILKSCSGKTEEEISVILKILKNSASNLDNQCQEYFTFFASKRNKPLLDKLVKLDKQLTAELPKEKAASKLSNMFDFAYKAMIPSKNGDVNAVSKFFLDNMEYLYSYDDLKLVDFETVLHGLKPEIREQIIPLINKKNFGQILQEFNITGMAREFRHPLESNFSYRRADALEAFKKKFGIPN